MVGRRLAIKKDRLFTSLKELAKVGAYNDPVSGLVGVNRLALTDADAEGRRLVKRWFEEAGLAVRVDRIGNTLGRRAGREANEKPVMSGSHIDSVPTGGAFDGALGVLGALEVVRTLNDAHVSTRRPIEIAFFTDEEGARFGTDMLGSAVGCGRLALEQAYLLKDRDGATVGAELERIGFLGTADERISPPFAYVEAHIEQGPILKTRGMDLGVVTGVQGISWQEVTVIGKSAHAGTTPMELRKDAGLAAAKLDVHIHEMVQSGRYGADMRATMGRVDPVPNRVNIVPGRVVCTIDLRNPDDAMMALAERDLTEYMRALAKELGVEIQSRQTAKTPRIPFAPPIQEIIARHMESAGHKYMPILSGAGHDAQELAAICPTAMIFVVGEYDGISHNPREYSTPEACENGINILLDTILELADA
jgi:N-carbamoyl-L-amino-acid hydrolase